MNVIEKLDDYIRTLERESAWVSEMAKQLAGTAQQFGLVLTIHTEPRLPPAMGRYDLVIETRPGRQAVQHLMQLEKDAERYADLCERAPGMLAPEEWDEWARLTGEQP